MPEQVAIAIDKVRFAAADGLYWLSRRIDGLRQIVTPGEYPIYTDEHGQSYFDMDIVEANRRRAIRAGRE